MEKVIVWGRIKFGLIFLVIGILFALYGPESTDLVAVGSILIGLLFLIFSRSTALFCADCGQFLGAGMSANSPCPRCGCNIYTEGYNGVGKTKRRK